MENIEDNSHKNSIESNKSDCLNFKTKICEKFVLLSIKNK
jgi:hypothetical protein